MKKLSLKQVSLIASICTGIAGINALWSCIETITLYYSEDIDIINIVRWNISTLGWISLCLFLIVLYSKQK